MKTLFAFLMAISCTAFVSAADLYNGFFTFYSGKDSKGVEYLPVCYQYAVAGAATPGTLNEPLVQNEVLRVCIVRDKRGSAVDYNVSPAVAVDAAGQLVCADCGTANFAQHLPLVNGSACVGNAAGAKWLDLRWTLMGETTSTCEEYITVGETLGVPFNKQADLSETRTKYGFEVFTTEDVAGTGGLTYVYLVALDTRKGDNTCEGLPIHVRAYAMSICYGKASQPYMEASEDTPRYWGVSSGSGIFVAAPGVELAWQPSAEIKSLVVEGNVLTGKALADYLTPKMSQFAVSEEGLMLRAAAPDVQYYTLYTKAKLSDTAWTKFEDYAKTLDNVNGKYYTRFRIDGESPLKIPVLTSETSRFYQLRGE